MKLTNLALIAARKRQSRETGFVHYCYEHPESRDTIPLFENFCFVLALFKTRMADHVLEGKALLNKLLSFQVGNNFPIYLHEFPLCKNPNLSKHIYPVIFWLLKDFHVVLGEDLRTALESLLKVLPKPFLSKEPSSPEEWAEFLILAQIEGSSLEPALQKWHPTLLSYLGHQKQEKFEPALTLYDLFLGELTGNFSARALQNHPIHLRASIVQSSALPAFKPLPDIYELSQPLSLLWGGKEKLHSLVLDTKKSVDGSTIYLEEGLVEEEIELAFFLSAHPENTVRVNNQKSNTFQLGDTLEIFSQDIKFTLTLSLLSGEGRFFGHIFQANRPGQLLSRKDSFDCYDWKLSLRTVKRAGPCQIRFALENVVQKELVHK